MSQSDTVCDRSSHRLGIVHHHYKVFPFIFDCRRKVNVRQIDFATLKHEEFEGKLFSENLRLALLMAVLLYDHLSHYLCDLSLYISHLSHCELNARK